MKIRFLKSLLYFLARAFVLFCFLMLIPSLWSVIYPEKPPVGYHFVALDYLAVGVGLESLIDRTPEVPANMEEIKNIEYKNVDGKSLQLDLYKPKDLGKPAPLLVFIHGGGWRGGKRSDYLVYLLAYAQKGYMTATVSYWLLKDAPYPASVEDVTDAVRWLFNNGDAYGYDPDRIALVGGSAGAHLAMLAAYGWEEGRIRPDCVEAGQKRRVKAVVNIYGPVDLTTPYAQTQSLVTNFLAHSYQERPELYREASPIQYVSHDDPPTMILHGTSDTLVPVSQSDLLKVRLDSLGVPCRYYRLPLWPHTMDIVKRVNEFSQQKMDDFFKEYLSK